MSGRDRDTEPKLLDTALSAAKRVARIAWMDCADGATRRALACEERGACPFGHDICTHDHPVLQDRALLIA